MSSEFRTREQEYARLVYEKIGAIKANPDKTLPEQELSISQLVNDQLWDESKKKAYGSLAHKLPVLIRTAGLAQSLAFVKARNKESTPQRRLLSDLEAVLRSRKVLEGDKEDLAERSRVAGFDEYLHLTEAALEALLWFKRFAQSELKVESSDEVQEGRNGTA